MVRRNMTKIHYALTHLKEILNGLTRGLDLSILDNGFGEQFGTKLSFFPTTQALGLVMPSNSPAVNSLWLPAIALKTPVIIKPGKEEPWTPYRLIQAFIAAGCPAEAFGFYPTDHEGAGEILNTLRTRAHLRRQKHDGAVCQQPEDPTARAGLEQNSHRRRQHRELARLHRRHGREHRDNGGRSCINASAIVVPKYAAEIADALAQKLGPVAPTAPDDENAKLSGFANTKMADFIDAQIEDGLKTPGATDVTAKYRNGPRKVTFDGGVYMRPTIVLCDSFAHPLANKEFLCPYASVVQVPQSEMLKQIGYSLAVTAITKDEKFIEQLVEFPEIERLNIGPISTMKISWDQPHEGNMFEFLYKRRSIERAW